MGNERTFARQISIGRWWPLTVMAGVAASVGVLAVLPSSQGLGLRANQIAPGQVRIEWDRSRAVMAALSATIEIRDGDQRIEIPLTAERLRHSTLTYAHEASNVAIRMRLAGARAIAETVYVVGAPVTRQPEFDLALLKAPPPPPPPVIPEDPDPEPEPAARVVPVSVEADRVVAVRPLELPPTASRAARREPVAIPAPPLSAAVMGTPPMPSVLPANLGMLSIPRPGPRSGRLIWTGELGRRGVVEIEGGRSTVGSLMGELPGMNVALRISPAEFAQGGLVVYTADRGQSQRTEPATKNNGWNATRFEFDPARAKDLVVLEAPNASNEFKRLALRSDARNCSVIVVDWSVP